MVQVLWFRFQVSGFRSQGLGFGVWGVVMRDQGFGIRD